MDRILRASFILIILFTAGIPAFSQQADGIAAIVDGQVITFSQVRRQVDSTEKLLRETYSGQELVDKVKEARLSSLRALIERQLIIQDFKKQGYFIPDNLIEDRLKETIQNNFEGDRTTFIRTLQTQGMTVEGYKKELKDNLVVTAMRQKNVSSAVIVSPFKIEQYYQDNIRQFLQDEQVQLSNIYMKKSLFKETRTTPQGKTEEYDPSLAAMQEILSKLETGSKFSDLARSYSEGTNRDQGGDMGWLTQQTLRSELAKVAFKLKPGQTSSIITTDDGYYIIRVEDRRRSKVTALADVRDEIEKTLLQEERLRLQQNWLDGLKTRYFIKMF
ncbi:MAG: peptidylprolyl isomerase [Verrucomicrobiota bacterium]